MTGRTWARATLERACGRCGLPIPPGAWVLLLTLPGMRRALPRCATCAREAAEAAPPTAAPDTLVAAHAQSLPLTPGPERLSAIAPRVLRFDARMAAANDRDPGEEG